jgi:hypothetical protein
VNPQRSSALSASLRCAFYAALIVMQPLTFAERKTNFETTVDFMGGASNQAGTSGQSQKSMSATSSLYPSMNIRSRGEHSELDLNYAFNVERYFSHPGTTNTSHSFTATVSSRPNKRFGLHFSDTFRSSSDSSMVNVLKGFSFTSTDFQYAFEPQLSKRSTVNNSASAGLDVNLGKQSYLTFGASGSYLNYSGDAASSVLSNQFRLEGNLSYSYRNGKRRTWSAKYSAYQNDLQNYGKTLSQAMTVVYAQELRPTLSLNLEAGPSYTGKTQTQKAYVAYNTSVNVSKLLHSNRFSFFYSHRSGDSTGYGSATDSHHGGLSFSRSLGQKSSINFSASTFTQTQDDYRGLQGSLSLSRSLGRYLSMNLGGSYQNNKGHTAASFSNENKRLFVSLRYSSGMR